MSRSEAEILAKPAQHIPFWISAILEFRYRFQWNFIFHAYVSEFSEPRWPATLEVTE